MRRLLIIIPVAAIAAFAAAPSAEHPAVAIPYGVTVDGVRIGGLTSEPARTRLRAAFDRPLRFVFRGQHWTARPSRFSASSDVEDAITHALQARPGAQLDLGVSSSRTEVRSYVRYLERRFAREPVNSAVRGVNSGLRPVITPAKPGLRVDRADAPRDRCQTSMRREYWNLRFPARGARGRGRERLCRYLCLWV